MSASLDDILGELNKNEPLVAYSQTDDGNIDDWIPTLLPVFDYNMIGGVPASGRVSECFGKKSSGKTTLTSTIIKSAIKLGMVVIYFDVEGTQGSSRLEELGVDTSKVLTYTPKRKKDGTIQELSIEEIGKIMISTLAKIHSMDPDRYTLFVWDSVAITESEMEANTQLGNTTVGQQAKALTILGRKLQTNLIHNNGVLWAINQARDDINAPNPKYAGIKTIGGEGWQHLLTTDISLAKSGKIKAKSSDTEPIGTMTRVQVVKSKAGDNWGRQFGMAIIGATGYDFEWNLVGSAQANGFISKGAWPKYVDLAGNEHKEQTILNLVEFFKQPENEDLKYELWQRLVKKYFPKCYPPLFNANLFMHEADFPMIKGLRPYYIKVQQQLPEEQQDYNYKKFVETLKNGKLPKDIEKEVKPLFKEVKHGNTGKSSDSKNQK